MTKSNINNIFNYSSILLIIFCISFFASCWYFLDLDQKNPARNATNNLLSGRPDAKPSPQNNVTNVWKIPHILYNKTFSINLTVFNFQNLLKRLIKRPTDLPTQLIPSKRSNHDPTWVGLGSWWRLSVFIDNYLVNNPSVDTRFYY